MTLDLSRKSEADRLHEVSKLYRDHISPDLARLIKFSGYGSIEESAEGALIHSQNGRSYLDFSGGYGVFSLGHRHPRVVEAVRRQLDKMPLSPRVFLNEHQAYLAQKLSQITPGKLQYSFFCNSGTEAVEGALKIARAATGRAKLVAAQNSYHGKTLGALSVTGREKYQQAFQPLLSPVEFVPFGNLKALEQAIDEQTAAFIIEPVQGEGGINVAPRGYLERAQELCRERGALLIADEVQSGLGRTGLMFGVDHWGVQPDVITLAKALGGGVIPCGAYVVTPEVQAAYRGQPLLHTSTFGGNPLACVAALATLEVLEEEQLVTRAQKSGQMLLSLLKGLADKYPTLVAEARGLGLMLGLELKEDKFGGAVITEMAKLGVIAVYTLNQPRVLRFEPPLNVERTEIEQVVQALDQALGKTQERMQSN